MEIPTAGVTADVPAALSQPFSLLIHYGLSILGAVVLLVGGWILAGILSEWAYRVVSSIHGIDETLARFFQNVFRYALLVLVFVTVLGQFGVQTASIVAALGAAGLAVGLALQGTLQNIAAGIMLLVLRPFRVGEYIETPSVKGSVREIGLFATEMMTKDGLYLMAPNSTIWNTPITNHSREQQRRQELSIAVGNDVDIGLVKRKLLGVIQRDERVTMEPRPLIYADDLTAEKTVVKMEYWARAEKSTEAKDEIIEGLKRELAEAGVVLK